MRATLSEKGRGLRWILFVSSPALKRWRENSEKFLRQFHPISGTSGNADDFFSIVKHGEETSMKYALVIATIAALATPALAEEVGVGVGVGPVGAGVTVGEGHRDVVRDHDRDRTTVIKEREPADRTTVIKKDHDDEVRSKTIIKERD
jgi:hypothetical protein